MSDENLPSKKAVLRCCGVAFQSHGVMKSEMFRCSHVISKTTGLPHADLHRLWGGMSIRKSMEKCWSWEVFWELCGLKLCHCHCVSLRVTVPSWSSCLRGSIFHPCRCHVCRFPSGRPLGRTAAAVVWFRRSSGRRSRGLTEKPCWTKQTKRMLMQLSPISSRQLEGMMQTSWRTLETFWHTSKPCLSPPQLRCRKAISQHSLCHRNVWVMFQSHRRWSWTSRMESPNGWFLVT